MSEERRDGEFEFTMTPAVESECPSEEGSENPGDRLGEFLPIDTLRALNAMELEEHKALQEALSQTHMLLGALKAAPSREALESVMAQFKALLNSMPGKFGPDLKEQAVDILVDMTAAIAACGMRSMLMGVLAESAPRAADKSPEEDAVKE